MKMKVKIYVDFENKKALNEAQYRAKLHKKAIGLREDNDVLTDFLLNEKIFTAAEIFYFTPKEKEKVINDFVEYCEDLAKEALEEDGEEYTEVFLEI